MARETYVYRNGKVIPKRRAQLAAHAYVISDTLDGVLNHADGKRYDSKSAYYAAVRAAGCEIIGNDTASIASRQRERSDAALGGLGGDIKTAIDQLRAGYRG